MKNMHNGFPKMTKRQRVQFISVLFSMYLTFDLGIDQSFVPSDFIKLAGGSFQNLNAAGVGNTLYFLAKGIGESREDESGPRMPLDRMPFGLIHHNLEFFARNDTTNLRPCDHYAEWQTTFAHFGHKWDRLFRGPMWSYDGESSDDEGLDPPLSEFPTLEGDNSSKVLSTVSAVVGGESLDEEGHDHPLSESSNLEGDNSSNVLSTVSAVDLLTQAVNETEGLAEVMSGATGEDDHVTTPVEVSSLWSGLNAHDRAELEQSSLHPQQVEEHHNMRPPEAKRKRRLKKDPMKVRN